MLVIHPDVRNALTYVDTVSDHLLRQIDRMRAVVAEGLSENRDIAVKVDMDGELVDLWLKPGILDRHSARDIAREITRLVTTTGAEAAAEVTELFRAAHRLPPLPDAVAPPPGDGRG